MATASAVPPPNDPALLAPWATYRLWACTSRHHKEVIDRLTWWSLTLGIGGAIASTLGEQIRAISNAPSFVPAAAPVIGIMATVMFVVAAFLSQTADGNNKVSVWTRSRAAAESLKSGIYLYRASAPPFDASDKVAQIKQRTEQVIENMQGVEGRQPGVEKEPDLSPLTVDKYITVRVQDQITYYQRKAATYQQNADRLRITTTVLLGIGAVLAAFSTVRGVSAWAPVVAAVAASFTAHLKNQQFQTLTATYSATALRLLLLLGDWNASGKTDADKTERNAFIRQCEQTMSTENGSWSALWKKS